ncbi:hypothetical protein G6M02_00010 [Agrobacterium rhizogenes]|nr:hypothetical protein [Rhizobium rhizogenes]
MRASLNQINACSDLSYVPQRDGAFGDCAIACFATVLGRTYEQIAAAFGFPCAPETGLPSLPDGRGIHFFEIGAPLLRMGHESTLMLTSDFPGFGKARLPSQHELKQMLHGKRAVLLTTRPTGEEHALAWKDDRVIDCREDDPFKLSLDDIHLLGAALIWPRGDDRLSVAAEAREMEGA